MTLINPLAIAVASAPSAQAALVADKKQQIRRAQALSKDVSVEDDRLEHQVESTDAIHATHPDDEQSHQPAGDESSDPEEEDAPRHIDIRA